MTRILLTGFEAFGTVADNPSQRIVEQLASQQADLLTDVLPVDYAQANTRLRAWIHQQMPDAIVMLGVAASRNAINLERIAQNQNNTTLKDNAGQAGAAQIIAGAPAIYPSTLPLEAMRSALEDRQIPVTLSDSAGGYLCNYVFYLARHLLAEMQRDKLPCGFIHVPDMGAESPRLPLQTMTEAITICLQVMRDHPAHV